MALLNRQPERKPHEIEENILKKEPTRSQQGKSLREQYDGSMTALFNEGKFRLHSLEATEELRQAPNVEVNGFTSHSRKERLKKISEKNKEYKEIQKRYDEYKKNPDTTQWELETIEERLDQVVREMTNIGKEIYNTPEQTILDDNEIKLMVKRVVPPGLREFVEKHCKIEYDSTLTDDQLQIADEGKIAFKFGPGLIKWEGQGGKKVPRLDKVMFQLGRMLGALISEPSSWKEYKKNVRILQNRTPEWQDFVALYLTDQTTAERIAPEGAKSVKAKLDQLKTAVSGGDTDLKNYLDRSARTLKFSNDFEYAEKNMIGAWGRGLNFGQKLMAFRQEMTDRLWLAIREVIPYKQSDWYERTLVEFEDKEVSRVLARDEHVTDRHKRLKTFFENNDEFGARTLIKSMTHTGDSRWWIYHAYLYQFDPLYRKTNGEEITRDSYSFLVQCLRISHKEKRHGTKPAEYAPASSNIAGGKIRIKRISTEQWYAATEDEIDKKSMREILAVAQEAYEWMSCAAEGRFFEIDEVFGDPESIPFQLKGVWNRETSPWEEETNNMDKLFDKQFVRNLAAFTNRRRFAEQAGKARDANAQGWFKLDPDQVVMLARLIAAREVAEENAGQRGVGRDPFDSEHFKLAQKRAVAHYRERVREYKDHRDKGGEEIPAYERFIQYIDHYKEQELEVLKVRQEGEWYSEEEDEAIEIVEKEPIISFQEDNAATVEKIGKVEAAEKQIKDKLVNGAGEKDKRHGGLEQLKINAKLKERLKRDPDKIVDYLDDPQEFDNVVDDIYELKAMKDQAEAAKAEGKTEQWATYRAIHNQHFETLWKDFAQVRKWYEGVDGHIKYLLKSHRTMRGWLQDLKPFREAIEPAPFGQDPSAFDREVSRQKQELFGDFNERHQRLADTDERYRQAVENKDWVTAKGLIEQSLGRKLEKKEEERLQKMDKEYDKKVKNLFVGEARKSAELKVYKDERDRLAAIFGRILPLKIEQGPMPRFQFKYLFPGENQAGDTMTEAQYHAITASLQLKPQDKWKIEDTALYQQVATKRDDSARHPAINERLSPNDSLPFTFAHLAEYQLSDQDRIKWLYESLRVQQALLSQKINALEKEELQLEEEVAKAA